MTQTAEGASKLNPSEFSPTLIRHQPQLSPQLTPASPSAAAGSSQARLTGAGSFVLDLLTTLVSTAG